MTNNENDPNQPVGDVDIDTQEDFDKEPQQKASLKDTWDNNPLLKIAAVVVVVGLLGGAYVLFMGDDKDANNSNLGGITSGVKNQIGKTADTDKVYSEAIEKENEQRAKDAEAQGKSSMPIPIGKPQDDALSIPPAAKQEAGDPLQEWRAKAEARRLSLESESAPPEEDVQAPDIVPMVQPIRPQPTMKLDPAAAKALTAQMQAIIATQAPKPATRQRVTKSDNLWQLKKKADAAELAKKKKAEKDALAGTGPGTGVGNVGATGVPGKGGAAAKTELIIPAGNIAYAQLLNDLNSDIVGPALAQVMSGPLEGGRAIGQFQKQDEYLTLTFKRVIKDGVSYSVNGIALNEETTLGALSSDVDHHYYQRVILPMAASFLTGYTQAASQTAQTTTTTPGGGVATDNPAPDPKQQLMTGATQAAQTLSDMLTQDSGRPITVFVNRGTTMGILFMDSVTTANAER